MEGQDSIGAKQGVGLYTEVGEGCADDRWAGAGSVAASSDDVSVEAGGNGDSERSRMGGSSCSRDSAARPAARRAESERQSCCECGQEQGAGDQKSPLPRSTLRLPD